MVHAKFERTRIAPVYRDSDSFANFLYRYSDSRYEWGAICTLHVRQSKPRTSEVHFAEKSRSRLGNDSGCGKVLLGGAPKALISDCPARTRSHPTKAAR